MSFLESKGFPLETYGECEHFIELMLGHLKFCHSLWQNWVKTQRCWLAWPSDGELWQENLTPARAEFAALCEAIGQGEALEVLVPDAAQEQLARAALQRAHPRFHRIPFGDIWMRDIAPTFGLRGRRARQEVVAIDWNFNAWGATQGRPPRPGDRLAKTAASIFGVPQIQAGFVAEGGAFALDFGGKQGSAVRQFE